MIAKLSPRSGGERLEVSIRSGHLVASGASVSRTATSVDAEHLWKLRTPDGSTIGNQRALSELRWADPRRHEAARSLLVSA